MKNSRIYSFLVTLLAMLLFPVSAFASTLAVAPNTGTFNAGCSFSVDIQLDTQGVDTDGTDVILFYDPSKLTPTTIVPGKIYQDYPAQNIDSQTGKISISGLASASQPFNGSGIFATVNFTVPSVTGGGAATLNFDFDPNNPGKTTDSNVVQRGTVADTLNKVTNGNYTINPTGGCGNTAPVSSLPPNSFPVTNNPNPPKFQQVGGSGSANPKLPSSGATQTTLALTLAGGILTVLGIAGLALL